MKCDINPPPPLLSLQIIPSLSMEFDPKAYPFTPPVLLELTPSPESLVIALKIPRAISMFERFQ